MDFQFLNERDGLFGSPAQGKPAPSVVMDTDGKLWFGTSGHLVSIEPAMVKRERAAPAVLLQAVLVNGSVIRHEDDAAITVDSRHLKNVEFDYIGVDLQSPERVTYQYMLEGQDKEWQDAGMRRQATYTNLKPSDYRFRVRAAIGTGQWSELRAGVPLTVSPAFYQTRWFALLCAAVALFMMWLVYQWRIRRVEALLTSQFRTRLSERTRIAQELHDTLLQGVLSASMQLHVANDLLAAESPAKPLLQRVLQLMGNVIQEGRNAVRDLRVSKDGPQDLEQAFSRIPEEVVPTNGTDYRVVVEGVSRTLQPMVRDEVFRIGREAIANAFRHSGATSIEVALEYGVNELRVSVRDNGCGIEPQVLQSGRDGHWGLSGMRERAERAGAKLRVWSSAANGTEIDLRVPARIAFESQVSKRAS
jgi:signal transduction histidine kinase